MSEELERYSEELGESRRRLEDAIQRVKGQIAADQALEAEEAIDTIVADTEAQYRLLRAKEAVGDFLARMEPDYPRSKRFSRKERGWHVGKVWDERPRLLSRPDRGFRDAFLLTDGTLQVLYARDFYRLPIDATFLTRTAVARSPEVRRLHPADPPNQPGGAMAYEILVDELAAWLVRVNRA